MKSPVLSDIRISASYIFIWILVSIIQTAALHYLINLDLLFAATDSIVFNFLYAALGLSLWFPVQYISIESSPAAKIIFNHLIAAGITSVIWISSSSFILSKIFPNSGEYHILLQRSFLPRFIIGAIYYAVIIALYYLVIYYNNFQEKKIRQIELEKLINAAELKSLKYQINPHFIFNSLNSISSLTLSAPNIAREMTIKLGDFLRKILSKNDNSFNSVEEEIENVKLYLEIEKIRFEDKFSLLIENNGDCRDVQIPSMLLQPLAENAIKYGVYEATEKIDIKIKCVKHKGVLEIRFVNQFDPESIPRRGEGIGLKNISERLRLIYRQDNLLQIEKLNNKFIVKIFIPVRENA